MKKFTLDIDVWTTVEAENSDEAFAIGQWLIDQLVAYADNLDTPIQAQVRDGGIEEEEEEEDEE